MLKARTAVDTIVLIAMASGESRSIEACRKLTNIGHSLLVPSTVMQECELLCRSGRVHDREIGLKIAASLVNVWGMIPAPPESTVDHGIALQTAKLIEQKFAPLPIGFEDNHGLVIADAGIVGCTRLLTWSQPLLNLPRTNLSLFLETQHIAGVQILTPDEAIAALCPDELR